MNDGIDIVDLMNRFGGRPAAARALGVTPQAIQKWVSTGRVPIDRVAEVERITGVTRYHLRPDIFGPAPSEAAE